MNPRGDSPFAPIFDTVASASPDNVAIVRQRFAAEHDERSICGAPETWFGQIVELEVKRAMKMKRLLISAAALLSFASVAQAEEPKASRSDIMAAYRSLTREEAKVIRRELAKLSRDEREALSRAYAGYSRAQIRDAMRAFAAPRVYAARSVKTDMPQLLRSSP